MSDYRLTTHDQMLEQAVSYAIDNEAKETADEVLERLQAGADFSVVAGNGTSGDTTQQTGSVSSAQTLPNVQNGGTITAELSLLRQPTRTQLA